MKGQFIFIIFLLAIVAFGQDQQIRIGEIEFYGYSGLDLDRIRTALPVREGDALSSESAPHVKHQLIQSVKQITGHEPTDISIVCCDDRSEVEIFIGLPGKAVTRLAYNPVPHGTIKFPPKVRNLYQQMSEAWMEAMQRGVAGEDDSRGYALSVDPAARTKQIAVRKYAVHHEQFVRRVLESAGDTEQRQIAAEILGYARQSQGQIASLVRASRDVDGTVRNNAVRALGVLARSNPKMAKRIPAAVFIGMLSSELWTDRNKASGLLAALSERRDPRLLGQLRARALESLIEMARWRSYSHACFARILLGRVAGIEETEAQRVAQSGQVDPVINMLQKR
jgi:hypothetical protein